MTSGVHPWLGEQCWLEEKLGISSLRKTEVVHKGGDWKVHQNYLSNSVSNCENHITYVTDKFRTNK